MKITKAVVKQFEKQQAKAGTKTAIFNLLWTNAAEQLKDIGVRNISTTEKENNFTSKVR